MKFIVNAFELRNLEELKNAGAWAVLLSTPFFSARGAVTIETAELKTWKEECDRLHLQCFVQVNRFFTEEELPLLKQHLHELKQLAIDGIYFGDEAVLFEAKELKMEDRLIYAPDTLVTNAMDAQFYLQERLQLVTLSKEITLEEICGIAQSCDASKLEVVIHGRLNMMHSKRHLLSNYMQFIGKDIPVGDKRTLYLKEETREEHMPIMEDELGTHIFSGFTLASFLEIKTLQQAGIQHVRIDSIFHDHSYTLEALRLYQEVLNDERHPDEAMKLYQKLHLEDHVTSGFYYTKTSKTK